MSPSSSPPSALILKEKRQSIIDYYLRHVINIMELPNGQVYEVGGKGRVTVVLGPFAQQLDWPPWGSGLRSQAKTWSANHINDGYFVAINSDRYFPPCHKSFAEFLYDLVAL